MTTPAYNDDHDFLVVRAVRILADALDPVVADMATAQKYDRYRAGDGGGRPPSTLADTPDASEVLGAMLACWGEVFQPYFGDDEHTQVRQIVCNVRSIHNYYVDLHTDSECDYEPYEALGEIARLLRRFYIDHAARQVDELKRELGSLMYGQSAAGAQSAAGDNVVVTKDALEALIADAVSLEVARQLRSEFDRVGLRTPDADTPPTPGTVPALPLPTVPTIGAFSDADVDPMAVPASAVGDVALVSAENVRLAEDAFNRGNAHVRQGEFDQAVAEYTAAIELNPQYIIAYRNRGNAYRRQGEYERAIADYTSAIGLNLHSQEAYDYYVRGVAYAEHGEYERAITDYTAAIGLNPQFGRAYHNRGNAPVNPLRPDRLLQAYYNRGDAYYQLGEYGWAIADYSTVIGLNPFAKHYYRWGNAYIRHYDRAIAYYTAAIGPNPQLAQPYRGNAPSKPLPPNELLQAYFNRGRAYAEQGDDDLAIDDYTAAIELDPQFAQAYNGRGRAYDEQGDYEQAMEDYTAAIELDPQYAEAYNNRGLIYDPQGEYEQAIADFTVAIELEPKGAAAYYNNRGFAHARQLKYDLAIADYTAAIELDPQDAMTYKNRGNAYRIQRDYDRAIADYTAAIKLNSLAQSDFTAATGWNLDLADAYYIRGRAYAGQGDHDRAIADFTAAIEQYPRFAEAYYRNRGRAYVEQGDYDRAIADFTAAIEMDPKDAVAYNDRAIAYRKQNEWERAIADYKAAAELNPSFAVAYGLHRPG